MRSPTAAMPLAEGQREVLEKLSRSQTAKHRDVQRARGLLLAADGIANTRIGADLGSRRRPCAIGVSGSLPTG